MNWLYYLAEANLYLGVFYLAYRIMLTKDTYYQLTRIYLLFACVASFTLPVLQLGKLKSVPTVEVAMVNSPAPVITKPVLLMQINTETQINRFAKPTATQVVKPQATINRLTLQNCLFYVYLIGATLVAITLLIKLLSLYKLTRSGQKAMLNGQSVIYLPQANAAFSFFNYLYIGTNTEGIETIIRHELVHMRQKHSADVVFIELLKVINWFNPFIYLMQNSLKTVHEYIADEQTAAYHTDNLSYSSFLVSNAYGAGGSSLTHSFFNYNLLKKRIIMLNQNRSGSLARLKYLITLPVCAGLLCASTLAFSKTYGWVDLDPLKATLNKPISLNHLTKPVIITDETTELLANDNGDIAKSGDTFEPENLNKAITLPTEDRPMIPMEAAGGYEQLNRYLLKNIHYKPAEGDKGGLVVVSFTVGAGRKVTDLKIATSDGEIMDNLALNAFKNYTGIVNDDEGKTLKFGVFFLTNDYSIFKRPFENDPGNSGWVTVTKLGFMPPRTSKGYEYNLFMGVRYADNSKRSRNVRIWDKNDQQIWYNADTATPEELKILKDKYGYEFPSNSYTAVETPKPKQGKIYLPYSMEVSSYLSQPYTTDFYRAVSDSLVYPTKQKNEGTAAAVLLKFNLDENGTVRDVTVAKSGGEDFDKAALLAVKSYQGTINDKAGVHTMAIVFCTAQNGKRPKVDESWKKTTGYVGELARGENKEIYVIMSKPKKS